MQTANQLGRFDIWSVVENQRSAERRVPECHSKKKGNDGESLPLINQVMSDGRHGVELYGCSLPTNVPQFANVVRQGRALVVQDFGIYSPANQILSPSETAAE
jgi:hypothetical protein